MFVRKLQKFYNYITAPHVLSALWSLHISSRNLIKKRQNLLWGPTLAGINWLYACISFELFALKNPYPVPLGRMLWGLGKELHAHEASSFLDNRFLIAGTFASSWNVLAELHRSDLVSPLPSFHLPLPWPGGVTGYVNASANRKAWTAFSARDQPISQCKRTVSDTL